MLTREQVIKIAMALAKAEMDTLNPELGESYTRHQSEATPCTIFVAKDER
jgi:hypothetical protein